MSDLLLDEETGDLALVAGRLPLAQGAGALRQKLAMRLRMVQGEWFADSAAGVDFYGQILGRKGGFVAANAELVRAILTTEGVSRLLAPIEYNLNSLTRVVSISARVASDAGAIELQETFGA